MPLERPSSDVDMVSITHFEKPFVTNIRRAFAMMDKLLTPKLLNVQALIALVRPLRPFCIMLCFVYSP